MIVVELQKSSLVEGMMKRTDVLFGSSQAAIQDIVKLNEESLIVKQNVDNIQSIANVVNGIMVLFNLLGLNASIEAACGVHGRGFTVAPKKFKKWLRRVKKQQNKYQGLWVLYWSP